MKIKFSGRQISFEKGLGDMVEIIANMKTDEINTKQDSDCIGEFVNIYVSSKGSIAVEKDTVKIEIVS